MHAQHHPIRIRPHTKQTKQHTHNTHACINTHTHKHMHTYTHTHTHTHYYSRVACVRASLSGLMLLEKYPLHMRFLLPIHSHLSLSDGGNSFCVLNVCWTSSMLLQRFFFEKNLLLCWTSGMRIEIRGSVVSGGEEEKKEVVTCRA
jgi:hypothetical protein